MGTKANPGQHDCYEKALTDEPMFVLLGRDKLAPALVRLWAEMREREGEPQEVVAEARQVADDLEAFATNLGKPVINIDSLHSFVVVMKGMKEAEQANRPVEQYRPVEEPWKEGEHATTMHSTHIGIVEKLLQSDPPMALVRYSATQAPSIPLASLRRPTREELDAYYSQRGRYT